MKGSLRKKERVILFVIFFFFSSFIQNPSGARVMQRRNVTLEHGFLEAEHKLGKVGIVQRIVSYIYIWFYIVVWRPNSLSMVLYLTRSFSFETFCLQEPEQGVWKIKFRFVYPLPFKTFWSKLKASLLSPQRVFQGCQGFERRSWIWSLRVCSTKGWLFKICKCMQFR